MRHHARLVLPILSMSFHINEIMQCGHLSFSLMSLRSIRGVACVSAPFLKWIANIPLFGCRVFFIHSSVDRELGGSIFVPHE